jgi:hypothetical protein
MISTFDEKIVAKVTLAAGFQFFSIAHLTTSSEVIETNIGVIDTKDYPFRKTSGQRAQEGTLPAADWHRHSRSGKPYRVHSPAGQGTLRHRRHAAQQGIRW